MSSAAPANHPSQATNCQTWPKDQLCSRSSWPRPTRGTSMMVVEWTANRLQFLQSADQRQRHNIAVRRRGLRHKAGRHLPQILFGVTHCRFCVYLCWHRRSQSERGFWQGAADVRPVTRSRASAVHPSASANPRTISSFCDCTIVTSSITRPLRTRQ
jgi:hypothetical protein